LEKDDFVTKIKEFLPYNSVINIKKLKKSIISIEKRLFSTLININPVFLKSDLNVIYDIIYFIKNSDKKDKKLKETKDRLANFYQKHQPTRQIRLNHSFKHRNISLFFDNIIKNIEKTYKNVDFSRLVLTWGRNTKNRTRSMRFGSFSRTKNLVRIHPFLDNLKVPDFFVYSVLYHEIAHFIHYELYPRTSSYHNKEFYDILKNIDPDFHRSLKWEKENKSLFFQ